MARETLVHERVIRSIEIEHALVFVHEIVEERLGFLPHVGGEVVVEVWIEIRIGMVLVDVLQPQPLRGESRAERFGAPVGEHAAGFALEPSGCRQLTTARRRKQRIVRRLAPQEE